MPLILYAVLVLVLVAADQIVKFVVAQGGGVHLTVIPGLLTFDYCENRGAAFSMLQNMRIPLIVATSLLVAGCIYALFVRRVGSPLARTSLALIIAGGASNLYDRIFKGYVVDFISFHFRVFDFAVFNVADSCVCIGAVLLCVAVLLHERRVEKGEPHRE